MKKNNTYMFMFASILFIGCNNLNEPKENHIHCDTTFYANGIIKSITQMRDHQKDGWRLEYDSNGILIRKGYYLLGKVNGEVIDYYKNGAVHIYGKWTNDKLFGSVKKFYPNGKLKQYSCYDFQEHCGYREEYDTLEGLISQKGSLVLQLLSENDFDSLFTGVQQKFHICVAEPPNSKAKYFIVLIDSVNSTSEFREVRPKDNLISLSRVFLHKGTYHQLSISALYDKSNNFIKSDTLHSLFYVNH